MKELATKSICSCLYFPLFHSEIIFYFIFKFNNKSSPLLCRTTDIVCKIIWNSNQIVTFWLSNGWIWKASQSDNVASSCKLITILRVARFGKTTSTHNGKPFFDTYCFFQDTPITLWIDSSIINDPSFTNDIDNNCVLVPESVQWIWTCHNFWQFKCMSVCSCTLFRQLTIL